MISPREEFMRAALKEALRAKESGDYPIGAVVVNGDEIIARSPNMAKASKDPTQHAEITTIRMALEITGERFLENSILYTTHEPCPMCATAAVWVKLKGVVYGANLKDIQDHRLSGQGGDLVWRTVNIPAAHIFSNGVPIVEYIGDFLRDECLKSF